MRWLTAFAFVLVCSSFACSSAPHEPARAPVTANAAGAKAAATSASNVSGTASGASPAPPPAAAMAEADALYRDQLATVGRDERFSTDRQIAALSRAILLYEQFIDRAGDDPRYAEAVKRSRERIADAKATLGFLREGDETR